MGRGITMVVASSNSPKKEKKENGTPISQVVVEEQGKETSGVDFSSRPGSDLNEKLILTATFCINAWSIVVTYIGTQIFLSLRIRKFMRGSSLRKYKESNDSMNARVTVKEAWYCDLGDEKYKDFKLRTDGSNVGKRIDVGEF